jgi:transcriptional regulator with XRE-family HTH domain
MREIRKHFGDPDRAEWAERLGVSKNTIASYERGETAPDASILAVYRAEFGIDINWIATGEGVMFADPSKAPAPSVQVDPILMETLYKAVDRAYRDMGQKPPAHRIANEAATLFNVLLSRVADVRDALIVDAVIPVLAKELVDRLTKAAAEPGSGKRSA